MILSNKRLCFFYTKYGALKKTVYLRNVVSLYSGQTNRYPSCTMLLTVAAHASPEA